MKPVRVVRATGRRLVAATRRHPGRTGLVVGAVVGATLALLAGAVLPGLIHSGRTDLEPGELVILSGADDGVGGQRQALIDQWNALPGRPHAKIIPIGGGADAIRAEEVARAQASKNGTSTEGVDRVDIYNLDVTLMAEFVEFDYLRPLDESRVDLDGFLDKPLQTCRRNGKLWALPFNTDAALLYYRSDLLGGVRPPNSWGGIRNLTDDVLNRPQLPTPRPVAGYTGQLADYEGLTVNAFEAIWAANGEVIGGAGQVAVDTDEAREGVKRLASGLQERNPQVILPESVAFKEGEATDAFRDGKVLFMRNWPVAYRNLSGELGKPALDFAVTSLPGPSVLGGQNLAIAASTDQPRAAQELIEFLTSPRSQQILFERGGFAATREVVYHDAKLQQDHPYALILLDAIKQARLRPDTPHYAMFSEVFRAGVGEALQNGGQLPDGFARQLADAMRGIRGN